MKVVIVRPPDGKSNIQATPDSGDIGPLTPVLDRTYPLRQTAASIRLVLDGHARGKVAITV